MKKDTKVESGLTVGVDLGDRWSRYCVPDAKGQILEEDTIATTGRAFRALFGERPSARVVIEVGTHSPWVQRLVQELGHETITANPRYVRLIYSSRKDFRYSRERRRINVYLIRRPVPFTRSTRSALQSEEYGHPGGHLFSNRRRTQSSGPTMLAPRE